MGTNYYLSTPPPPCPSCGAPLLDEDKTRRHIGKSSRGWRFSLRIYPDEGILGLEDWLPIFRDGEIHDEYGGRIDAEAMLGIILLRAPQPIAANPAAHTLRKTRDPHGELDTNGLLRHLDAISSGRTWDCFDREFS